MSKLGHGLMITAAGLGLAAIGQGAAAQEACSSTPMQDVPFECLCAGGDTGGAVWGSNPYTSDSDVCTAATHAGVNGNKGGLVHVVPMGGQDSYPGSTANGVTTREWGSYGASFTFQPESPFILQLDNAAADGVCSTFPTGAAIHTCTCGPGPYTGSVWGNGPYTSDSDLCTAARHSGVIGDGGGMITVLGVTGLDAYSGTSFNGVTTLDWGSYGESFMFDRN